MMRTNLFTFGRGKGRRASKGAVAVEPMADQETWRQLREVSKRDESIASVVTRIDEAHPIGLQARRLLGTLAVMSYSWLRVWRLGPMVLSIAACGGDQGSPNSGLTCGEGTVQKAGKCIPQCGAGTVLQDGQCVAASNLGAAGNASQGGSQNKGGSGSDDAAGSAGESEADAGSAGENENNAGSAGENENNAGSAGSAGSGGTSGSGAAGSSGTAGSSNGGTAGSNQGGSGGTAGSSDGNAGAAGSGFGGSMGGSGPGSRPQWVAIQQSSGLAAYDLTKFPSASGLVSLETTSASWPTWSPDGRWLLYVRSGELYSRDMTAATPAPPLLLASLSPASSYLTSPSLGWSADSKSAAFAISPLSPPTPSTMLQVFDPTHAAPLMRTLSNNIGSFSWAPVGDRIMYQERSVTHVRRVQAGVPGPEVTFDSGVIGQYYWSTDGNSVITRTSTQLTLTDVTQASPTPVALTNPSVSSPSVSQSSLSADGASLLFSGTQIRDGARDLFRIALKPSVGAAVRLSTGLTGTATVSSFSTSSDGKWVVYNVSDSGASTYWAVDLSGASPSAPFQIIGADPIYSIFWVPDGSGRFLSSPSPGITVVDVPRGTVTQISGVSGSPNFVLSPIGTTFAYAATSGPHLYVRDLDHLDAPVGDVPFLLGSGITLWRWSPNGKFIATWEGSSPYGLRLIRMEGTTPSTAIPITSTSSSTLYWQPLAN